MCGILEVPIVPNGYPEREPSKSHTNAIVQPVIFSFILRLVIRRGLELMAGTLDSTIGKEEVGV